ncbi:MAG TPA: tetratricopeptide repeat protein [Rhizomicrobium sp.]|nr:tetratricopeptide repeat protein [Rhizomicrobium sp.]
MHRFASRFAGVAVCAIALAGCASDDGAKTATAIPPVSRMSPDNTLAANVNDALSQAQALRTSGDFESATRIMAQLMLAQPDDARIVGEYGKLLAQENRSTDAVNFLRRAVELQPSDWTYYSALGVSYDQLGDHDNARLAYERALSLKPGTAVVLNNYAMSRMLAGDANGAHVLMAKAQATGSLDPRIAENIARLDAEHPAPAPVAVAAIAPVKPVVAAAPVKPVVAAAAPVKPVATPTPLVAAAPHANANRIVMQDIPVDTHAGPVDAKKPRADKKHVASVAHPVPVKVADGVTHASPIKAADIVKPVKAADIVKPVKAADAAKPVKAATVVKPVKVADTAKPVKAATAAKPAKVADTTKPVKKAKSDGIPALRQTADASKP